MSEIPPADTLAPPNRLQSPPFQFRLRTLMLGTAACSLWLATMIYVGPYWSLAIGFVTLVVAAHVAGNAIGTSLRSRAPTRPVELAGPATNTEPVAPDPAWQHRSRLGRATTIVTLTGAVSGALGGLLVYSAIDRGQLTVADRILGVSSFAVIAGWLGFMASSFVRFGLWPAALCVFAWLFGDPEQTPPPNSGKSPS